MQVTASAVHQCKIQDLPRGEGEHSERATRAYEGDLRVEPPVRSWGSAAGGVKAFCPFSHKEGPKVKDFIDCSPPCPSTRRQTVTSSRDQYGSYGTPHP